MTADLFDAIRAGNRDEVERLLMLNPELIHAREKGLSPVLAAAYQLEPGLADFLADKTVAINIFEAAATGRTTYLIRLLARKPALVNAVAEDGFQPLGLACFFGHLEAADYLLKAGASVNVPSNNELHVTPLQSAVAGGHTSIVRMLLKNGAQPNVYERGGLTPLHTAAANGDAESIQLLILAGADLHMRNNDGKIPLNLAQEKGHSRAVEILKREITKRFRAV
jgi:ankyrin repeat protein